MYECIYTHIIQLSVYVVYSHYTCVGYYDYNVCL